MKKPNQNRVKVLTSDKLPFILTYNSNYFNMPSLCNTCRKKCQKWGVGTSKRHDQDYQQKCAFHNKLKVHSDIKIEKFEWADHENKAKK